VLMLPVFPLVSSEKKKRSQKRCEKEDCEG
jgi:hypothetical protein